MSFSTILLVILGSGLVVGTLYVMIRAIFLPNPSPNASPRDQSQRKQEAKEKRPTKKVASA